MKVQHIMQHIMMGSALLLLTACHHVKGDEIPPGGEKNIADAISAGGQKGPSNIDDQSMKTDQASERQ